ncbi:MAG: hypothetical protein Q4G27_06505 [Flavobacteriaceae bacterium]|nr:hypothetical protein [Flavobacteriaceae bacterium]
MDKKEIYGKSYFWSELAAFPLIIYYRLKGKNIKQLLYELLSRVQKKYSDTVITFQEKEELLIQYEELNNFFAYHFKKIDSSRSHNFDEKINYCLNQFKKESNSLTSASKLVILQENFLKGAEQTLSIYFKLNGKTERRLYLSDILVGKFTDERLKNFLLSQKFIDENNNLIVDNKSFFFRILKSLKDKKFINQSFTDKTIVEVLQNEYNSKLDNSLFSKASNITPDESETEIIEELISLLDN